MLKIVDAEALIEKRLSPKRYIHSCNVAKEAKTLAGQHGDNEDKAYLAGLLHDYAKGLCAEVLTEIAEEHHVIEDEIEYLIPDILHAQVGAVLLKKDNFITDGEILHAIASHTLGDIKMSKLDKIIFLADMIEPSRDYPGQERLYCLAYKNLDDAMLLGLELTIKHCLENNRLLHPKTVKVRNVFLQDIIKGDN